MANQTFHEKIEKNVPLLVILVIGLGILAAWNSVEFKDELLRNPLMGDDAKRAIVLSEP